MTEISPLLTLGIFFAVGLIIGILVGENLGKNS